MESFPRTRVVTDTQHVFIVDYASNPERFWVFRNLGPSTIRITTNHKNGESNPMDLHLGDDLEANCISAEAKLAQGESNFSVLQWMPGS